MLDRIETQQLAGAGLVRTTCAPQRPARGTERASGEPLEVQRSARELAESIVTALAQDRRADAIRRFFEGAGMPPEMVDGMSRDPELLAIAPTMFYDLEVMGDRRGGRIPEDLVRAIHLPTLVLAGAASPDFFRDIAARIAELLPNGTYTVLGGQDHGAPAEVVAPVVAEFFAASERCASSARRAHLAAGPAGAM